MMETLFELPPVIENKDKKQKRKWENAFQRWSDKMSKDGTTPEGCCGFGQLCDFCEDNSYGRPCVRALNALCRTEKKKIDYSDYDFKKYWWY